MSPPRLCVLFLCLIIPSYSEEENLSYHSYHTSETITVDGILTEKAWEEAGEMKFFVPETGTKPISLTEAGICWNSQYLFVRFKAYDRDIGGALTERDSSTFREDVLEIFLKPLKNQDIYYNFEINALGTVYDARNGEGIPWKDRKKWNCQGLLVSTKINGTMNQGNDEDETWQMEVGIPWSAIDITRGRCPRTGDTWRFHLARYDYSRYLPDGKELSSCAPLRKVNFHNYHDWIPLKFCFNQAEGIKR
ncbi:carbohydrate-binding family 9-like protein [Candidatus Sumerlaeota bacterium]|nr:carbohydrate-binding family 9-like protein [Candidatus Sumerlaeota bacterium]